jgi:hypothetical protein
MHLLWITVGLNLLQIWLLRLLGGSCVALGQSAVPLINTAAAAEACVLLEH